MKTQYVRGNRGSEPLKAWSLPSASMKKLTVAYQPVTHLTSNPLNPRVHSDIAVGQFLAAFPRIAHDRRLGHVGYLLDHV